jgi:hypothetical protein
MSNWHDDDDDDDEFEGREDPADADMDADDADEADTELCPFCRQPIYAKVDICPYCRAFISTHDAPARKPKWLWFTAIVLVAAMIYGLVWILRF